MAFFESSGFLAGVGKTISSMEIFELVSQWSAMVVYSKSIK